jgi:hypothetical protein
MAIIRSNSIVGDSILMSLLINVLSIEESSIKQTYMNDVVLQ